MKTLSNALGNGMDVGGILITLALEEVCIKAKRLAVTEASQRFRASGPCIASRQRRLRAGRSVINK